MNAIKNDNGMRLDHIGQCSMSKWIRKFHKWGVQLKNDIRHQRRMVGGVIETEQKQTKQKTMKSAEAINVIIIENYL